MTRIFKKYFFLNKFRLITYTVLGISTIVCFILVKVRMAENYEEPYKIYYVFLLRNLDLAWIPFLIALVTYSLKLPHKIFCYILPFSCLIWLIFFPNAPYLVTDFLHLRLFNGSPKIWFDVVLVIWFAFTGLFLGFTSLFLMHRVVQREFGTLFGWALVTIAVPLSSVGIYIGRYLRFNSWDVLQHPTGLVNSLINQPRNANSAPILTFVFLHTLFFIFIYTFLYVFGNLLREDFRGDT